MIFNFENTILTFIIMLIAIVVQNLYNQPFNTHTYATIYNAPQQLIDLYNNIHTDANKLDYISDNIHLSQNSRVINICSNSLYLTKHILAKGISCISIFDNNSDKLLSKHDLFFNNINSIPRRAYTHIIFPDLSFYKMKFNEIQIFLVNAIKQLTIRGLLIVEAIDFDNTNDYDFHSEYMRVNPLLASNILNTDTCLNNIDINIHDAQFHSNTKFNNNSLTISEKINFRDKSYFIQNTLHKYDEKNIISLCNSLNLFLIRTLPLAHTHPDYNQRELLVFQLHDKY
jgi:hypothetical protein